MYLWTAADLSKALFPIREKARALNREIALDEAAFTLPAHVSLKISFPLPDERAKAAMEEMEAIFRNTPAFDIFIRGIERIPGCLWIGMEENEQLSRLHEKMAALSERCGAPPHPYDLAYRYHATLFLSENEEKLQQMERALRDFPLPESIRAEAFIIGGSATGRAGDYQVFKIIPAREEQ